VGLEMSWDHPFPPVLKKDAPSFLSLRLPFDVFNILPFNRHPLTIVLLEAASSDVSFCLLDMVRKVVLGEEISLPFLRDLLLMASFELDGTCLFDTFRIRLGLGHRVHARSLHLTFFLTLHRFVFVHSACGAAA